MITLTLGYITLPFDIIKSTKSLPSNDYVLSKSVITLSIQGFLQSPPVMYPTIERHIIRLSRQATATESNLCNTLFQALCQPQQPAYGIIQIENFLLGILTPTGQGNLFTIHVVESESIPLTSNHSQVEERMLDLDSSIRPIEILKACQLWPNSKSNLENIANQIYKIAMVYGYWENWRLFEGICQRHEINPQQFIEK